MRGDWRESKKCRNTERQREQAARRGGEGSEKCRNITHENCMWNKNKNITDECTLQLFKGPLLVCARVCAWLCWVVVYGQLSAPQGHHTNRDSRGLGPSPSGTPWPLKSCHFRAAVHCSPWLISWAAAQVGKSGPGPGFQHRAASFPAATYLSHMYTNAGDLSLSHTPL